MTIGPIPPAINLAELREPFAFPLVGVLWLHAMTPAEIAAIETDLLGYTL